MLVFGILNTFSGSWEVEAREEPGTEPDAEVAVAFASVSDFFLPFLSFFCSFAFLLLSFPLPLPFAPSGSGGVASQVNEAPSASRALLSSKFLVSIHWAEILPRTLLEDGRKRCGRPHLCSKRRLLEFNIRHGTERAREGARRTYGRTSEAYEAC
jgi:hypothetical protein